MSWAYFWKRVWHIPWSSNPNPSQAHADHKEAGYSPRWQGNGQCIVLHGIDARNITPSGEFDFQRFQIQHACPPPFLTCNNWAEASHTISCYRLSLLDGVDTLYGKKLRSSISRDLMRRNIAFNWALVGSAADISWAILGHTTFNWSKNWSKLSFTLVQKAGWKRLLELQFSPDCSRKLMLFYSDAVAP